MTRSSPIAALAGACALVGALWLAAAPPAAAQGAAQDAGQGAAFRQAVAEGAFGSEPVAAFYRERGYRAIFTGAGEADRARRGALLSALQMAGAHGLPAARYDPAVLIAAFREAESTRDRGQAEALAARMLVDFARDIHSGVLDPSRIDRNIVRTLPRPDPVALLERFAATPAPHDFFARLAPQSAEYNRLLAEKLRLERLMAAGGWGPQVPGGKLAPGDAGPGVVALRDRLVAMGYLTRSAARSYDGALQKAVQSFQIDHGLIADGIAGGSTLTEINRPVADRRAQVLVALERERWLNLPEGRGARHVLVNLTDYSARIIDDDKVTFETRSIIGEIDPDTQTPEFSDTMEYLEINPDWTVPRGIIRRSYLPRLQSNPGALGHLQVVDRRGRVVPRSQVNFARYSASNFPYNLRQPPGPSNALGTVKFMFPNRHAIYLHDTPDKSLFSRERRAFSNGCIRLNDPHDFAYALLARQVAEPEPFFQRILRSGRQSRVNLEQPVPVHLIYRTAFTRAKGRINFRHDVYGRDAKLWSALQRAGVSPGAVRG